MVRRIVGVRDNRPLFSDTLGRLLSIDERQLTVDTAAGPVRVPLEQVARAKRVPARRRPGAADIAALELAAAQAWPAPQTERLGDWLLRAADRWTGRANSALPVGDPGLPLGAAIDAVLAWYADRRLPAQINVPLPLAASVDRALDERGWRRSPPVLVQAAELAAIPGGEDEPPVALDTVPAPDWLDLVDARKGGLPPAGYQVLTGPALVRFASVREEGGELLAVGRGAVTAGRLHLGLIEVVPRARRHGLAGRLTRALAGWAVGCGADTAYLQVAEDNTAALALYAKLGFTAHHTYVARTPP